MIPLFRWPFMFAGRSLMGWERERQVQYKILAWKHSSACSIIEPITLT